MYNKTKILFVTLLGVLFILTPRADSFRADDLNDPVTYIVIGDDYIPLAGHQVSLKNLATEEVVVKNTDPDGRVEFYYDEFPVPLEYGNEIEFDANSEPNTEYWESLVTAEFDAETQNRIHEVMVGHNTQTTMTIGFLGVNGIGGNLIFTRNQNGWVNNAKWQCYSSPTAKLSRYCVMAPQGAVVGAKNTIDDQQNHQNTEYYRGWVKLSFVNSGNFIYNGQIVSTVGSLVNQNYNHNYTGGPQTVSDQAVHFVKMQTLSTWKKIKISTQMDIWNAFTSGWRTSRGTYSTYIWMYQMSSPFDNPGGFPMEY